MLGTIVNMLLFPVYVAVVLLVFVLSLLTHVVYRLGRLLEDICEILSDVFLHLVKKIDSL